MRVCASQIWKKSEPQICKFLKLKSAEFLKKNEGGGGKGGGREGAVTHIFIIFKVLQNFMVGDKFTKAHICKIQVFVKKMRGHK